MKKILTILLFGCLLSTSCKETPPKDHSPQTQEQQSEQQNSIQLLDVQKANQLTKINDKLVVLDVRTPGEYQEGHLNNAHNIDFHGAFSQKIKDLDKDQPYLVYCRSGGRSNQAAQMMVDAGFKNVYDMQGGITAWNANGLPSKK